MATLGVINRASRINLIRSRAQLYSTVTDYKALDHLNGGFTEPKVQTESVPGPISKDLMKSLNTFQLSNSVQIVTDYEKSMGNYMVDADGNVFMDLFQQIGSLALGYNNPTILASISDPAIKPLMASRPAMGLAPPAGVIEQMHSTMMSFSPPGMDHILPMMCGSCSNENAFKLAFFSYMNNKRGGDLSQEDLESAAINQPPGCPKISVMSFEGAFHGRTTCLLSVTHTKPLFKVDVPVFDWPIAPFPQLKYPLEENIRENEEEERRCLTVVEELFSKYANEKDAPVAALIIEPIQSEGGDKHASPEFFRSLQQICKKNGTVFIVDEVQTGGGGTGTMWAHTAWDLPEPPQLLTFAKKFQVAGAFATNGMFPELPYRIYNTWMGEPSKLFVVKGIMEEIQRYNLLEVVKASGTVLLDGLKETQSRYPSLIHSARGVGTYCAFSTVDPETCIKLVQKLRNKGFFVGPCGTQSIRFRPALVFQPKHANQFIEALNSVLAEM